MSDLTVTPGELSAASSGVRSSADSLDSRIKDLKSRVDALLDGGWKGQAADAFRRDWEQWLHGANDVVGGLDTTAGLLASSASTYAQRDSANSAAVDRASAGLNLGA